jgi:hypothetical protein
MSARIYSKWIWWVFVVGGAFLAAGAAGGFAASRLHLWPVPVAGFCSAAAVVVVGYLAAPAFKLQMSGLVFIAGAVAAWVILEPSWLPESYGENAYQPTHLPVLATYCGGMMGLLVAALLGKARGALKRRAGNASVAE